jgi:hypothetical protein
MLKSATKPQRCMWCNSNVIADILRGTAVSPPGLEQALESRQAVWGASVKGFPEPAWQCMDCGAQIYRTVITREAS